MAGSKYSATQQGILFCSFIVFIVPALGQIPPGPPQINGPTFILEGNSITLSCSSSGGNPTPTVKWYEGSTLIDEIQTESGGTSTNDYTFIAQPKHHLAVFECQVDNNVLQNPLTSTWFFQVYAEPDQPVLTGPTTVTAGTPNQYKCVSVGGNPKATMQMRHGNTDFDSSQVVESSQFIQGDNSFNIEQTATWTPTINENGERIFCVVDHPETRPNNPQVVDLPVTVNEPLSINAPQLTYTPTIGTLVILVCDVTGPATIVRWYKNNSPSPINIAANSRLTNGDVNNPSLSINNVQASDSGQYVCQATDGSKTVNTNTITVNAQSLPTVVIQQPSYSTNYGNSVTLVCTVTAVPFQTRVYWRKDNTLLINAGDSGYSGSTPGNPSLTINSATTSSQGQYRCYAENPVGNGNSDITTLTVIGGLLSVAIPQPSYSAVLGTNSVTITCTVSGTPSANSVAWTKIQGGQTTNVDIANSNGKYQGGSVNNPSLTILNVAQSDEANYVCSATNIAGTSSSQQAFLDVTGSIPVVTILQPSYITNFGDPVTLECTVSSNPLHTIVTWQKIVNGQPSSLNLGNSGKYSGSTVNTPSLTILSTNLGDPGVYRCLATNVVGTGQSQDTTLTVNGDFLTVTIPQPSYSAILGTNSVTITCFISGNPSATSVSWSKNSNGVQTDLDIANSNGKYQGGSVNTPSLTILNVAQSDEANYVCSATNLVGTSSSQTAFLDVTGSIPVVNIPQPSYSIEYGNPITIECTVTANPLHTIVIWQKIVNGQPTTVNQGNSGRYTGGTVNTPSLTIQSAVTSDSGVYRCLATNAVGTGQSQDTTLTITGGLLNVVIPQPSYSSILGSNSVTIDCVISGTPSANSVAWTKIQGGQTTNVNIANSNGKYQGGAVNNPSLTILNIAQSDEANYVCSATNIAGTSSSQQAFLDVTGSLPIVTIQSPTYSVVYGNSVTLGCTVSANPLQTVVFWQRIVNGQPTSINFNSNKYSGSTVSNPSLTIFSTVSEDIGVYRCLATNVVGTGQSQDTTLTVDGGLLSVTIPQPSYSAILGSPSVRIECIVSGIPSATSIEWTKNNGGQITNLNLANNNGKYQGGTLGNPSLTILNIAQSDEANYVCKATNIAGTASSQQAFLDVTGSIPVVNILSNAYTTQYGNDVTLECTVTANPLHTVVFWQKIVNGQPLSINLANNAKYIGSTVGTPSLTILSTNLDDPGQYRCSATNVVGTGQSQDTTLTVTGDLLNVQILQNSYSALLGSNSVTIDCTVTGNPAATSVSWTKTQGGQTTNLNVASSSGKYQGSTINTPSLTILNIAQSDEANYVCSATNIVGTASSQTAFLDVTGNPPNVNILQPLYSVLYGNTITIECTVTANPLHTVVIWQKIVNGQPNSINQGNSAKYSGGTVNTPSLTIQSAVTSDSGVYRCSATNAVGTGQSQDTTLTVTGDPPTAIIGSSNYQALVGNTITIGCTVTANPVVQNVYWERDINGVITTIGPSTNPSKYGGSTTVNPSLTINNVDFSDEGNYRCYATNIVGTGSSNQGFLDVSGQPPTVVVTLPNYQTDFGNSVTLGCTVTANPVHTIVYWRKIVNGVSTNIDVGSSGGKYSGSTVSSPSLIVNNANLDDRASYVCYAENSIGVGQSTSTVLNVLGEIPKVVVPQPQYNVDYGTSVTLTCTVTANPIHTVVYWQKVKNGVANTVNVVNSNNKYSGSSVGTPSLTINNVVLDDEASYICFATNGVGTGQSSQTFVDINGGIPSVAILSNSYSVVVSGTVTLQCVVNANPIHTVVQWQKIVNGQITNINLGNNNRLSGSTVNSPSLTISQSQFADEGNYICTATNPVGTGTSQQTFLDVTGTPPIATVSQSQYQGSYAQSITLVCTVTANPPASTVYWRRLQNGQMTDLTLNNIKYSGSTVGTPSLTVSGLDLSDEGFYQCFAENSVGVGSSQQTFLDVLGNIPTVKVLSNSYNVILGNTITLGCQVDATPRETVVFWRRVINGQLTNIDLGTNNNNKYSGSTVSTPSLTITNAQNSDEGNYVCYATNLAGTGSSSQTFLDVVGSPPVVSIAQSSYSVNIGNSITLFCTVSATPPEFNIYWTRAVNNQQEEVISTTNSGKYSGSTVSSPSLVIFNTDLNDIALYRCHAENSVGIGQSNTTTLTVVGNPPIVTIERSSYSVNYGNTVTLTCTVTSTPLHTSVYWRKVQGGQQVNVDMTSSKYSGSTVNTPSLTISNTDNNDETFYVCYASNVIGTGQSSQTYLDVLGTAPSVRVLANSYSVLTGQTATLECVITANPAATSVQWYKVVNGQQQAITSSPGKYNTPTVNNPNLVISTAQSSDEGYYVCSATNIVATASSSQTFLDVTGNPPTVTVSLPNYATKEGTTVTLGCTVVASPAASRVWWTRVNSNGQNTIVDMNNQKYGGSSVSNPSLIIFNPSLADEGNYICYAENVIGQGQSTQTYLDVTGAIPTVTVKQSLYSVDIAQPVTLECTVVASPIHTSVYWQKIVNGVATTITANQNKYSGSSVGTPSLTIGNVDFNDEAYYICFATNEVGTGQSAQTYLDVIGSRPIVNIGSTSYSVNYGNSITLVCTVTANPVHTTVSWTKIQNGVSSNIILSNTGKYSGSSVNQPSLTINNAGNSDEAFYVCSATNSVGTGQSSQTYLDVVGEFPIVQILSNYYDVEIGKTVTVECQVQANPAHTSVQWKRVINGVTSDLDVSNGNKYIGATVNTPSLTIQATTDSDEGYYICTATNAVGTGSSSQSYVDVTGSILSVTIPQPSYSVNYGQNVQLVCTVSGNPAATSVYWEKVRNGITTTINSNTNTNKYTGSTVNTPSLTVLNAKADDQAVYTCFAENAIGKGQSQQTQLQIIGSVPSVTVGQGYSVNLGNSITLKCTVFATPSATVVEWNKFDQNGVAYKINVASQSSKYSGGTVNTPSLTILNAEDDDETYYTCQATNAAGTGTSTQTYLDVLGSIPIVTIPQPQYSVTIGNSITMECSITANPAQTSVQWKKIVNGQPQDVSLGSRYSGATVATPALTITNAESTDKGYYVCYASNGVGQGQSAQTYLNVVGNIPVVTVLSTSYSVNIANSVTLQCTVTANPSATTVMWQRIVNNNAVNVDMTNPRYSGSTIQSPSLVISNVAGTDEGFYICMASNSVGTGQSQQTFLDVVGSVPQVTVPVPNYTVNRGASITLECSYTANPEATSVTWERIVNGQATDVVLSNNNKYGGSNTQSPSLIINNANESDEGSYLCKVTNSIGTGISSATTLDVVGNIPVVTAAPLAYSVNVGSSVTLKCSVSADPLHTSVTWKKIIGGTASNIPVTNSGGKYSGATVSDPSLTINNAAFSDQGTYVCYATNSVGTGQSTQVVVAVAGSPPIVTLSQTSFSANFGESVTLGCVISADPTYTSVYWQKVTAGNPAVTIDISNTAKYEGSTVNQPSLTIKDVGSGDIANYICFAANSVGTGQSSQGTLNVAGSAPTVRISQTTYPINIGKTVTIDCTVTSNPAYTSVYWTRQIGTNPEETLSTTGSLSTKYGGSSVVSPSLTIYNVEESDQGTYICHATNIVGTGQSSQAFLDVVGNVPIVTATTVQSTRVGSSVTIQCTVIANPPAIDITWAKYINNQPIPVDIENNARLTGGTTTVPSLTINPVEQDDEGNYICQARNDVGTGSSNQVFVDITGDPPTMMAINPTKITIEEGQTITVTCTAQGSPDPTYAWYKVGSPNQIATGSVFEVVNAPKTALGTYTCKASNNYGSNEATVIVDVQYKPVVIISDTISSFTGQGRQSINIPCSYTSNPAATSIFWTKFNPTAGTNKGNSEIIIIDGNKYQGGNLNSPSLAIYNLDKSDEASYRCSASNIIGQGNSAYITLGIDTDAAPSYIRVTPSQVVLEEGNSYTLTCEADGDPAPLYEWYYKDIKIHEGNVLIISNAAYKLNDGLHTCKASNKIGSRQVTVDVDVKYAPITDVKEASFNPALGHAVTLRCDTLANPSSTAWSWKYNGFDLDFTGKTYLVDMDSTADVGRYTCIAYNEVGQSSEIEFTVGLGEGPTPTPQIIETVVSGGLTGGEIAAICLAALFGILLIVIIIVCCVVQGCCRSKRRPEKERYIERVVTREAEVPAVVREPSVVSVREVTPRISYVDDSYRYLTTAQPRPYYLPIVEATYDDEEHRRRNKKKKKSKRYQEELARDDGIYLEERVVGSVRSRKGEEVITGPEMYFEAE